MTIELTIQVTPELAGTLEALTRDMGRDPAEVVTMAIDAYIAANARQARHIREALDEANSGTPGVPHEEVVEWVKSWETDNELSRPVPKRR